MERTLDNIEKLSLEIVDQMDMETLIAAALEFTYDFYHKKKHNKNSMMHGK